MEVKIPLKLRNFQVVSDNTNKEEVIKDLKEILDFIYKEEEMLFSSNDRFFSVCDYLRNNKKQQSNSMGRYMGLNTSVEYPYQNYNVKSAFRSIAIDKTYSYIQSANLFRILNDFDTKDVKEIKRIYRSRHITKTPTTQVVEAHIHRFYNKGDVVASKPGPAKEFPLSQTDMFYCTKTEVVDNNIFITVKLSKGETTLKFRIPKHERFTDNVKKYSRPNVVLEEDNLVFIFTVFKDVEEKEYNNIMGVDIGKVESFVATVVYTDEKEYSAPFFSTKNVNVLTKRIENLFEEIKRIDNKIEINERCNHPEKVEVLEEERRRKRNKISILKDQRASLQANTIVKIADANKSNIVLEELNWVDKGGTWERAIVHEKIENLAKANGIEVSKVSARDTSNNCPKCNRKVSHNSKTRMTTCKKCNKKLDRDVLASRNIAKRKNKEVFKELLKQKENSAARIRESYAGSLYEKVSRVLQDKPVENLLKCNQSYNTTCSNCSFDKS